MTIKIIGLSKSAVSYLTEWLSNKWYKQIESEDHLFNVTLSEGCMISTNEDCIWLDCAGYKERVDAIDFVRIEII